jgi:hypothetical protein
LGHTRGWKRSAVGFYEHHDRPKQVWIRELDKHACKKLRAPEWPPQWAKVQANAAPHCTAKAPQIRSLVATLRAEVPECRSKHALAYPIGGMLALIALAMFSGVRRGPQDLAEYAATLSQGQLRALGFRLDQHSGKVRCPGVTPFRTVLRGVDARPVERALLLWQEQVLGPAQDRLVIVDGKTLRHAQVELVSAVNSQGRAGWARCRSKPAVTKSPPLENCWATWNLPTRRLWPPRFIRRSKRCNKSSSRAGAITR